MDLLIAQRGSDEWRTNIIADLKNQGLEAYANIRSKATKTGDDSKTILENRARYD